MSSRLYIVGYLHSHQIAESLILALTGKAGKESSPSLLKSVTYSDFGFTDRFLRHTVLYKIYPWVIAEVKCTVLHSHGLGDFGFLVTISACIIKVKGGDIGLNGKFISELWSVTRRMGSHSVTCHPTQVNAPRLNPSQIGWYSICLPWRDGRLS